METCASIAETVANSIAASSIVLINVLMLFSPLHPSVRTKRRNASGSAIGKLPLRLAMADNRPSFSIGYSRLNFSSRGA